MKLSNLKYLLPLLAAPCWGGILTVSLNPLDGALTGAPGDTVVWGVQAVNSDSTNWLLITSVQAPGYAGTGATGEIPDGASAFTDYLSVWFLNNFTSNALGLAPGQVIDQGFLNGAPTVGDPSTTGVGLASFAISPTANAGQMGPEIQVLYDVYDDNPFTVGNFIDSEETDVNTSVTVDTGAAPGGGGSGTPEPATWLTLVAALPLLFKMRRQQEAFNR
jgi:hypothetical protein